MNAPDTPFECVVVASNRGPVSFESTPNGLEMSRGSGGVVSALTGSLRRGGVWVAAAMSDGDREAAAAAPGGVLDLPPEFDDDTGAHESTNPHIRYLTIDPADFDPYYNEISNGMLWFVNHYLWETALSPTWDAGTRSAWEHYVNVNEAFADALAEEGRDKRTAFLIQDYHLALVPGMLRERLPGATIAHFSHTPIAGPTYIRVLPTHIRRELLRGMLGADILGFHSRGWMENFLACVFQLPDVKIDYRSSIARLDSGRRVRARVYAMSVDVPPLQAQTQGEEVKALVRDLEADRGDRALILRVERLELSKNIHRGFLAIELLLQEHPELVGRIVHLAILVPSRTDVPEYKSYADDCIAEAKRINEAYATADWRPIDLRIGEDFSLTLAAYSLYDVLLVNPVIDGLNLVAMEGPVLNHRGGVLVLSRNAGAYERLSRYALGINPYDIEDTASALFDALTMERDERRRRARGLARLVRANPPSRWVERQITDLARLMPSSSA